MGDIDERLGTYERFLPKDGYNLVGVDEFEEPGEELFLIDHFATRAEAEKAQAKRKKEKPDEVTHIYGPPSDRVGVEVTDAAVAGAKKKLTHLMGPEDLKTKKQRTEFAGQVADGVVGAVQAERKRQGLPPLT